MVQTRTFKAASPQPVKRKPLPENAQSPPRWKKTGKDLKKTALRATMTKLELPPIRRRKACGQRPPKEGGLRTHFKSISPFGGPDGELTAKR